MTGGTGLRLIAIALSLGAAASCRMARAQALDIAPLTTEATIAAPQRDVWHAFTSNEGVRGFFAPASRIELRVGGPYELYFLLDNAPGSRGGEGAHILALEPPGRLMVTWIAPPSFGHLREQQMVIEISLEAVSRDRTRVRMVMAGFGRGSEWARVREYFTQALQNVLGRLAYRFDHGPIDWQQPVNGIEYLTPVRRDPAH